MKKLMNKRGFTLIEMLIVVAIVAILVSISIPMVSKSTADAKTATDAANLRAAKAVATISIYDNAEEFNTVKYYDVEKGDFSGDGKKAYSQATADKVISADSSSGTLVVSWVDKVAAG